MYNNTLLEEKSRSFFFSSCIYSFNQNKSFNSEATGYCRSQYPSIYRLEYCGIRGISNKWFAVNRFYFSLPDIKGGFPKVPY